MPDDILKALCRSARATPAELELLKKLRDEAFKSDGQAWGGVNRNDAPSGTRVSDQGDELSAPRPAPPSGRTLRGRGRRWVFVACVAVGLAAGVVIFIVQALDSSPRPSSNCGKYEVTMEGNVVNDAGNDIGNIFPKDVFIVDRSPGHPQLPYRYYGTVENRGVSGHVLQKKLNPLGPCI